MIKFKENNQKLIEKWEQIFDQLANKFNEYILSCGDELFNEFSKQKTNKEMSVDSFIESCIEYILDKINGDSLAILFMESQLTENNISYKNDSWDNIVVEYIDSILNDKWDKMVENLIDKLDKIGFNIY